MYPIEIALTELAVNKITWLVAFLVTAFGLFKAYTVYLSDAQERLEKKLRAQVDIELAKANVEIERFKKDVALAKEGSVGAEAIQVLREADRKLWESVEAIEKDIMSKFQYAEKEREAIKSSFDFLRKEHAEFIQKSLEYFMTRK